MNRICSVLLISGIGFLSTSGIGQDVDWDSFRLPQQYSGTILSETWHENGPVTTQKCVFTLAENWLRMELFLVVPGVGDSLQQVRYCTFEESLLMSPIAFSVSRGTRFRDTLTDSGEVDMSPLPIVRAFAAEINKSLRVEVSGTEQDVRTVKVWGLSVDPSGYCEIDVRGDEILEYRTGKSKDGWASRTSYSKWVDLPSGSHVPTEMVTVMKDPGDDPLTFQSLRRLVDFKETDYSSESKEMEVPSNYTIIDNIDGVTRRGDGSVIAEIERIVEPQGESSGNGSQSLLIERVLIWGGVLFIIVAGVVWGKRMKGAA